MSPPDRPRGKAGSPGAQRPPRESRRPKEPRQQRERRPLPAEAVDDVLRLSGIQAYGHLGVTQRERDLGQRVEADVELAYPPVRERRPDTLDSVIDYEELHRVVRGQIEQSRCRLLETLAEELALALLAQFDVDRVRVRVRKLHIPVSGFTAVPEVAVERRRA